MSDIKCYEDLDNEEYHATDAISRSDAITILKAGTATAKYQKENKSKTTTPAMAFGSMFHTGMESVDELKRLYIPLEGDARTKKYKDAVKGLATDNPGCTVVKQEAFDQVLAMRKEVMAHPIVRKFSNLTHEVSLFGEVNGVEIKARPDALDFDNDLMIDWKTTQDASEYEFNSSVRKYGYWMQPAWYTALANKFFDRQFTFLFVCVEKTPPYNVAVYDISSVWNRYAASEMRKALSKWKDSTDTGSYTGYYPGITTLQPPQYVTKAAGVM